MDGNRPCATPHPLYLSVRKRPDIRGSLASDQWFALMYKANLPSSLSGQRWGNALPRSLPTTSTSLGDVDERGRELLRIVHALQELLE